jgi:hypothetical protein
MTAEWLGSGRGNLVTHRSLDRVTSDTSASSTAIVMVLRTLHGPRCGLVNKLRLYLLESSGSTMTCVGARRAGVRMRVHVLDEEA